MMSETIIVLFFNEVFKKQFWYYVLIICKIILGEGKGIRNIILLQTTKLNHFVKTIMETSNGFDCRYALENKIHANEYGKTSESKQSINHDIS